MIGWQNNKVRIMRKLSDIEKANIIKDHDAGMSIGNIAKKYDRRYEHMRSILVKKIKPVPKLCTGCNRILPPSAFGKNNVAYDGLTFRCRKCMREYARNYYATRGRPQYEAVTTHTRRPACDYKYHCKYCGMGADTLAKAIKCCWLLPPLSDRPDVTQNDYKKPKYAGAYNAWAMLKYGGIYK